MMPIGVSFYAGIVISLRGAAERALEIKVSLQVDGVVTLRCELM